MTDSQCLDCGEHYTPQQVEVLLDPDECICGGKLSAIPHERRVLRHTDLPQPLADLHDVMTQRASVEML